MKAKKLQIVRAVVQVLFIVLTIAGIMAQNQILSIIFLLTALLIGPVYCGWSCPFGFLQEWIGKIGKKILKRQLNPPKKIGNIMSFMRYIFVVLMITDIFSIKDYDSRSTLFRLLSGETVGIILISIMLFFLLISFIFDRPYCRYFCPQGAVYGIFSLLRPITINRSDNLCVSCKKCDNACPMQINISEHNSVGSPQCINCFSCVSACPVQGTLKTGFSNPFSRIIKIFFKSKFNNKK